MGYMCRRYGDNADSSEKTFFTSAIAGVPLIPHSPSGSDPRHWMRPRNHAPLPSDSYAYLRTVSGVYDFAPPRALGSGFLKARRFGETGLPSEFRLSAYIRL